MTNSIKKVGITGANGNIGTTLQKGLAEKFDLTLFDLKNAKTSSRGKFVKVDCGQRKQLAGVFNGLDAVIHLAGDPRPNAPRESTLKNNFAATSFVFEEAKNAGVKKVVFAGSNFFHQGDIGEALRDGRKGCIRLEDPPTPQCLYGESKVFGESLGRHLSFFGVQFASLRIGWTVPEDNPALYGGAYMRAIFCSHRDLVQAFTKALETDQDFLVGFAVSNNSDNIFDMTKTEQQLGFVPQDDSKTYF